MSERSGAFIFVARINLDPDHDPRAADVIESVSMLRDVALDGGFRVDYGYVAHKGDHLAVCSSCGESWPCQHEKIERKVRVFAFELSRLCGHCGKSVSTSQHHVVFSGLNLDTGEEGGAIFHTAKSRYPRCRAAALNYRERWDRWQEQVARSSSPAA